jgi:K+-transporting ATPase ATPase C chain
MTGIAQLGFADRADGRPQLIARSFTLGNGRPDPRYFQPRPSQSDYSATATFFSNRGPSSPLARAFYRKRLTAYLELNGPYDPGLTRARVPVDAVTTSGSGVDPHILPANARIQAHRIAEVRRLAPARVQRLIDEHTDGRSLGLIGELRVNVRELNLALDEEARPG